MTFNLRLFAAGFIGLPIGIILLNIGGSLFEAVVVVLLCLIFFQVLKLDED